MQTVAGGITTRKANGGSVKVGEYQIGRYHAIIKKEYADGSVDYETSFSDRADLIESVHALQYLRGQLIGIGTNDPKVLTEVSVIRGKEKIIEELSDKEQG